VVEETFQHLSLKPTFGWGLIKGGDLPTVKLGKRKTIVRAVDIVRLIEEPPIDGDRGHWSRQSSAQADKEVRRRCERSGFVLLAIGSVEGKEHEPRKRIRLF
jgi:hypothetical protein